MTRRCHPFVATDSPPAFLRGDNPRRFWPIAPEPTTKARAKHDRQVLLILVVAIVAMLAYWRGHVDGSTAEREAQAIHAENRN